MLTAFCLGGLRLGHTGWSHVAAGLGIPVVVIFWGALMAPRSARRIPWPWRPLTILVLCWGASGLIWMTGYGGFGLVLALVGLVNVSLLLIFGSCSRLTD